ncbi:MAG: hypothetical protein ACM34B_11800, partial [Nitrospira sp.]
IPPADLTTLAQKNNGEFPSSHVAAVLRGEEEVTAHGSTDMPVWGPVLLRVSQGHAAEVQHRISSPGTSNRYRENRDKFSAPRHCPQLLLLSRPRGLPAGSA